MIAKEGAYSTSGFSVIFSTFIFIGKVARVIIMSSNPSSYQPRFGTREPEEMERLIKLLKDRAEELGHKPRKTDVSSRELGDIKSCFGKWCYALEAAGFTTPSKTTLARRHNKMEKWERKHEAAKKRNRARRKKR